MQRPVGIFDSGIGGLTVLKALKERLPGEKFVYFGDTGRVPYGNKGKQTVTRYSIEIANYLIMNHHIKALVVACNTASSLSFDNLRRLYRIPLFDVVTPAVSKAASSTRNGRVGVIGTSSTIRSNAYRRKLREVRKDLKVFQRACPLFVPLVEEGWIDHSVTEKIISEYLTPLRKNGVDTLILGCTHYPFLRERIAGFMGRGVKIIDSAGNVAREVGRYIRSRDLLSSSGKKGTVYLATDDPDKFREHGLMLLGKAPRIVHEVAF